MDTISTNAAMSALTAKQRDHYERDGFLVIEDFLDRARVSAVEADIAALCAQQRDRTLDSGGFNLEKVGDDNLNAAAAAKRPGMLRKVQGAVGPLATVREVFCSGRLPRIIGDLTGADGVYYHSSKVMFKPRGGGAPKPWHQDAAYWPQYAAEQVTVWIAIHDADQDNGCVWAIPGSHKLGLIPHAQLELQVAEAQIDVSRAVPVPVPAGGLLIFHSLVLHMSHRNTSPRDRWAIICDYDTTPNPCIDLRGQALPGMDQAGVWKLA